MAAESHSKSDADTGKRSTVAREQLEQAAKLRAEGATWNAIREATGTKLGSSAWFRHWEREGIEHIPAGERVSPSRRSPRPLRRLRRPRS